MRGGVVCVGTIVALNIVSGVFGHIVSMWVASVLLAYCIGAFWGAGDEMRKQGERGEPCP
jgi:hypothetical protein